MHISKLCRCVQWSICIGPVARKQVHTHLLIIISLCVDLTLLSKKRYCCSQWCFSPRPPQVQCWWAIASRPEHLKQKNTSPQHCIPGGAGDAAIEQLAFGPLCKNNTFFWTGVLYHSPNICFCERRPGRRTNVCVFVKDAEEDAKTLVFLWKTQQE